MDVILNRQRECIVDNQAHIWDVEATGSNVCGDHNADLIKGMSTLGHNLKS